MSRIVWIVVGGVVALAGVVFFLQGVGVLGGSAMSGKALWAILGPIIAIIGVTVAVRGARPAAAFEHRG